MNTRSGYRVDSQTRTAIITLLHEMKPLTPTAKILYQIHCHLRSRKVAKLLALDYVEHVLWIGNPIFARDRRFERELALTRKIVLGEVPRSTAPATYHNIVHAVRAMQHRWDWAIRCAVEPAVQYKCRVDHGLASAVMFAVLVCYENELVKLRVVYPHSSKTYRTLHKVVIEVAQVVWKYHAGLDAKAHDHKLRREAYYQGKQAVQSETQWQLKHLLEVLNITDIQLPF